jgi:hypothetical protein
MGGLMELFEQVMACIDGSGTNDYQQRSALGIARTWVDKRKPHERVVHKENANETKRDDLAEKLIELFEAVPAGKDEYIDALTAAREVINLPYFDPRSNGAKTGKAILKPRDKKKEKG